MERRKFVKTGTLAALSGVVATKLSAAAKTNSKISIITKYDSPEILTSYTAADHRKRLESIGFAEQRITPLPRICPISQRLVASVS